MAARGLEMESAQLVATIGILIGIAALLFAVFALMWQMNSQNSRLETKIDEQGKELREKIDEQGKDMNAQGKELETQIDTQGKELETQIDTQGKELETQIDTQGKELRAEIIAQGQRVSDAELEQARLNGVNSVLTRLVHTHEAHAGDD